MFWLFFYEQEEEKKAFFIPDNFYRSWKQSINNTGDTEQTDL